MSEIDLLKQFLDWYDRDGHAETLADLVEYMRAAVETGVVADSHLLNLILNWYDRDHSVGGLSNLVEDTIRPAIDGKRKLYVYRGFCSDYTDGLAVALATSLEEAQKLISDDLGYTPINWGNLQVFDLSKSRGFAVSGGG